MKESFWAPVVHAAHWETAMHTGNGVHWEGRGCEQLCAQVCWDRWLHSPASLLLKWHCPVRGNAQVSTVEKNGHFSVKSDIILGKEGGKGDWFSLCICHMLREHYSAPVRWQRLKNLKPELMEWWGKGWRLYNNLFRRPMQHVALRGASNFICVICLLNHLVWSYLSSG